MPIFFKKAKKHFNAFFENNAHWWLWVTLAALLVRVCFFSYVSTDYSLFLQQWFDELKANGGILAIGQPVGNYMVSYVYILALLTHLPVSSLVSIKLVSILGDVILAFFALRIVEKISHNKTLAKLCYTSVLFLPTVILNSGAWAQCDSIYTAGLLACVYYALDDAPCKSMVALGVSFAFKMQAVFLAPFVFFLLLKKRIRFWHLFFVPLVYGVTILPAFLAGRPLKDLLFIYFEQAETYPSLSMNAPNVYTWLKVDQSKLYATIGVLFTGLFILVFVVLLALKSKNISPALLLKLALFSVVLLPFFLPHMHERYFYPADCLALIYGLVYSTAARKVTALTLQSCSFLVVCAFLFDWQWVSAALLCLPMLAAFAFLLWDVWQQAATDGAQ